MPVEDTMKNMVFHPYSQCGEDKIAEPLFMKMHVTDPT